MRRAILVGLLCAMPAAVGAQEAYIVGNTLVPGLLVASGKAPSRGTASPAPSTPSPAPSPAATFSSGSSGESSFSFQYQAQSSPTVPPPTAGTLPVQPVELPPIVGVVPLTTPHATLSIPVQVIWGQRPGLVGRRPMVPDQSLPVIPPGGTCPTGCIPAVPDPAPQPAPQSYYYAPTPEPLLQPYYTPARRICNAGGACIQWP